MKFHRIIGKIDPKTIAEAEKRLSAVCLELCVKPDNQSICTKLGGNPLLFSLIHPMQHIATPNIITAATDGKHYYWNPDFILAIDLVALRLICEHEAWHAIYMHPQRIGRRNKKIWNIAVDFVVNAMVMDGLQKRHKDAHNLFTKHLGRYMTLDQYLARCKDPEIKIPGLEEIPLNMVDEIEEFKATLPKPDEDKPLTEEQRKEMNRLLFKTAIYYADMNIPSDMLRPEKIYDVIYKALPRCPKCGRVGVYIKQPKIKHTHHICKCDECCGEFDILSTGDTLDDHMESVETQEQTAKRIADGMRMAKSMGAGDMPGNLEEELGLLTAPKVKFTDFIKQKIVRTREGNSKNNWSRFRSRPLAAGMLLPKRKNISCNFGVLLDTSGSMDKDSKTLGVSQLQVLDDKGEGTIVCGDTVVHFDKAIKLRKFNKAELMNIKSIGGGGTMLNSFFTEYEKNIGKCDFLIVITDGGLNENDIINLVAPSCPTYWLITSDIDFKAPFGKTFRLNN